ncbi:MAG TPA: CsbD family protein, partial [Erythrobacter sp.]|nr:CsbD family protein [Erythrobacter sp.]
EAVGKAKQNSNDPETKADGAKQELKGKAQQVKGDVEGAMGDKI